MPALFHAIRQFVEAVLWMRHYGEAVATCPLCGETEFHPHSRHRVSGFLIQLSECAACGIVIQNPRLSDRGLDAYYSKAYRTDSSDDEPDKLFARGTRRGAYINEYLQHNLCYFSKRRMADVGCGYGGVMGAFRAEGWDVVGCDLEGSAPAYARSQGLDARNGKIDVLSDHAGQLDLVVLSHVVEHVPDPVDLLTEAGKLLAPGGYIYIEVPGIENPRVIDRQYAAQVGHLIYFKKDTIIRAIKTARLTPFGANDLIQVLARNPGVTP